jgi:hypothetical protein
VVRETRVAVSLWLNAFRDMLHYKNERTMPFSGFLDKLQKTFNIFEEENKAISGQDQGQDSTKES